MSRSRRDLIYVCSCLFFSFAEFELLGVVGSRSWKRFDELDLPWVFVLREVFEAERLDRRVRATDR